MKIPWLRGHFLARRQLDRLFLDLPDAAFRHLTGRRDWPPYSLRSFVGGARDFDRVGAVFLDELRSLDLFRPGTRILDIGCGCGRMARALAGDRRLRELEGAYTGMDIDRECVEWCRRNITPVNGAFTFYGADCFNRSYNPRGMAAAGDYVFPHFDISFDVILLNSVMTHLLEHEMRHYLAEVSRMLAPGGVAYTSFFLYKSLDDAAAGAARHGIRFPFQLGNYAVNREDFPTNAVAYRESYVRSAAAELGFEILEPIRYGPQDALWLTKAPGTWVPPRLERGWHAMEDGCWRWTERRFAVHLSRAASGSAALRFRFQLPKAIMDEHQSIRLSARAGGVVLPPRDYAAPGDQLYVCEIPDCAWVDGAVLMEFELDKAREPSDADRRELGMVVKFMECSGPLKRRLEPFVLGPKSVRDQVDGTPIIC
ncbi:MAG: class I SAM-dependent methyltransferase [Bryobacteraceae bacterium]